MSKSVDSLLQEIRAHPRWAVLTGAGVSAASGIPTYRDHAGLWLGSQPIQHQEFLEDALKRRRYWTRSVFGWPRVAQAKPNATHAAIANLELAGRVAGVITQNVDRLHQAAGSRNVIDLHGRLDKVRCLQCHSVTDRSDMQGRLLSLNALPEASTLEIRPDGDANLPPAFETDFRVPACLQCEGVLMPEVVFFGGSVPTERVEACFKLIDSADGLLVIGTSLTVYSGFRFCRHAHQLGKPLVILNKGSTRADELSQSRYTDNPFQLLIQCANALCGDQAETCHA